MRPRHWMLFAASLAMASADASAADLTLFQYENFTGQRVEATSPINDLSRLAFNDSANSAIVERGTWQLCSDSEFQGACVILGPGRYATLRQMGLDNRVSSLRQWPASVAPVAPGLAQGQAAADRAAITFFQHEGFQGTPLGLDRAAPDFRQFDANDAASSLIVRRGHWQVCEDIEFRGRCAVFGPGRYPSLQPFSLNDTISSARPGGNVVSAVSGDLQLFEHDNFAGRRLTSGADVTDLGPYDFSRRVSSVIVEGGNWQLCSEPDFRGQCIVLGPGRHPSMRSYGLNDAVASARRTQQLVGGGLSTTPSWTTGGTPAQTQAPAFDANAACIAAAEARVREENPRAGRVQVMPQSLQARSDRRGETQVRGRGEFETRRDVRRFGFECSVDARGAHLNRLRYGD